MRKEGKRMNTLKEFWEEEDGITTVEILLILAVLIVIAILFRDAIVGWVQRTIKTVFEGTEPNVTPPPSPS